MDRFSKLPHTVFEANMALANDRGAFSADNMLARMDREFGSMFGGGGFGGGMLEGFGEMANKMISSGHRQEGGQHGPGTFTSSSFVMSSSSGRDGSGRPHVEAFSESTVGGRDSGGCGMTGRNAV